MSHVIDFNQLSLRDTLDLAISIEEEAKERYDDFAEQMDAHHTADTAKFFRFMAANEVKHAEKLAAQRKELFGDEPNTADSSVLYDIEAPEFDAARAFMSVRSALDVAMQSEIKAYEFYDNALTEISDAEVRELFLELRDQESQHQEMIKQTMAKVPEDDGFDPDDFVDEPAAQ
jgi:rubrerythrin